MNTEELVAQFPARRISPFDGMTITASVWNEAHEYHRQHQQIQTALSFGSGILGGLEVHASDPPDRSVYISPGFALDSLGRIIVLPRQRSYDLGSEMDGLLYLVLMYEESQPVAEAGETDEGAPLYVNSEFVLQARPAWPAVPCVELARIRRVGRDAVITDALRPDFPGANELDLRFRRELGLKPRPAAQVAICYVGGDRTRTGQENAQSRHTRGLNWLIKTIRRSGDVQIFLDDDVPISDALSQYALIYLVGQGSVQLDRDQAVALRSFVKNGGFILAESCRQDAADPSALSPTDTSLERLLNSMLTSSELPPLAELPAAHPVLSDPFVFAAPPPGFESDGQILVGQGVILSRRDYGCLWQGQGRGRTPSRSEIRAAQEWGVNMLTCALSQSRTWRP